MKQTNEYFDDEVENEANAMLIDLACTGICNEHLIKIAYNLYWKLLQKSSYNMYENDLKKDMVSLAIEWMYIYGRNYNPNKGNSKHPAYSYLTTCGESAFKRVLTAHYKHVNINKIMHSAIDMLLNGEIVISEEGDRNR